MAASSIAIGLVFFNPAGSRRMLMNYLYVANAYRAQGLGVFTIELVFDDARPEIVDAFHVRGRSHMFHKERLCRLLETRIPAHYDKLVFLDADVLLSDGWIDATSAALEEYDVVHPFEHAHWLDLDYQTVLLRRRSAVLMAGEQWNPVAQQLHPGFGWAFRRDWYCEVGFFDHGITGSGDALSAAAWMRKTIPPGYPSLPPALASTYRRFSSLPEPRIGYLQTITISHLYHGPLAQRQYFQRHRLLEHSHDIEDLLHLGAEGVFEWNEPSRWNPVFLGYFNARNDDAVGAR